MSNQEESKQEVYLVTTAIKGLADKIARTPADYVKFEDDIYQATITLSAVWQSIRTVQRMGQINKVDAEMLDAKLKIGSL